MGYTFPQLQADVPYPICEVLYEQETFTFQAQSAQLDPQAVTDEIETTINQLSPVSLLIKKYFY